MAFPVSSQLFEEIRSAWPSRPYPLLVDHLESTEGRVCPAASLYALSKVHGDRLRSLGVENGEVVACFPATWIEWAAMLLGCFRRGACFASMSAGSPAPQDPWIEAVGAGIRLNPSSAARLGEGRRLEPCTLIVGPPAMAISEIELIAATRPEIVDPLLEPERPVWLDHRLAPLANALAVVTLLRAGTELHVGATTEEAVALAEDDHRFFGGAGASSSMAAVRGWARAAS